MDGMCASLRGPIASTASSSSGARAIKDKMGSDCAFPLPFSLQAAEKAINRELRESEREPLARNRKGAIFLEYNLKYHEICR